MSVLLGTDTCKKCGMKNSRNQDGHCAHCGAKVDTDDRIPLELQAEPLNKALRVFEQRMGKTAHDVSGEARDNSGRWRKANGKLKTPHEMTRDEHDSLIRHIHSQLPSDEEHAHKFSLFHENNKLNEAKKKLGAAQGKMWNAHHMDAERIHAEINKQKPLVEKAQAAKDAKLAMIDREKDAHNAKLKPLFAKYGPYLKERENSSQWGSEVSGVSSFTVDGGLPNDHKFAVYQALKAGRHVSARVLKDYPGIKEKVASDIATRQQSGSLAKSFAVFERMMKSTGENCPHCNASMERGDDGKCNRCGKEWPVKLEKEHIGFDKLKTELSHRPGVTNPGGLAAYIGDKKYGKAKMERGARTHTALGKALTAFDERLAKGGPGSGRRPVQPQHSGAHNPTIYRHHQFGPKASSVHIEHWPEGTMPHVPEQAKVSPPVSRVQEHTPTYAKSHDFMRSKGSILDNDKHVRVHYKDGTHHDMVMPEHHVRLINSVAQRPPSGARR